jgi:hypothetical protein
MPFANTRFHSVGQGCFYSGEIYCTPKSAPLRMVYDCGSETPGDALEREISSFQQLVRDAKLDMLVLSHLDADHVNGLSLLLDNGLTAENVFLPYLTPAQRAIAAAGAGAEADPNYFELLANPVGFLEGRGVANIIFVNGGEDDEERTSEQDFPPFEPTGDNGGPPNLGDLEDDMDGKPHFFRGEESKSTPSSGQVSQGTPIRNISQPETASDSRPPQKAELHFKSDRKPFRLTRCWQGKFFHRDDMRLAVTSISGALDFTIGPGDSASVQRYKRFLAAVHGQFGTLDAGRLVMAIRNEVDRKKLRDCYYHIRGNHNDVSLVLWHRPIPFPARTRIISGRSIRGLKPEGPWKECNGGTLLTGDLTFTDAVVDKLESHLGRQLKQSAILEVPHHGSSRSWNPRLLGMMQPGALSIISAGLHNIYGHPHGQVTDFIERVNGRNGWFLSNERKIVEMHIETI